MNIKGKFGKIALGGLIASTLLGVTPVLAENSSSEAIIDSSATQKNIILTQEEIDLFKAMDTIQVSKVDKTNETDGLDLKKGDSVNAAVAAPIFYGMTLTRGGSLAWCVAHVDWTVAGDGSQINTSTAYQTSGYVFPNYIQEKGVTKQNSSAASYHIYLSQLTYGAGVVTPWGDVQVTSRDYADYIRINKDGSFSNY